MTVDDFARGIPRFADLSHPERIRLLAWYLHTHKDRERFDSTDIGRCYDEAHVGRPANLPTSLRQLSERTPHVLLRDSAGYRLAGPVRQELDARYGQRRDLIAVNRLVTDLIARVPDVAEKSFLQETITCYTHGAFRAAIVMAWALAMDHVLEWILGDPTRVATFNARIPARFPHKKPVVTVSGRIDFQNLKEWEVIAVLGSANLIPHETERILDEKLKRRNTAAHPSTAVVTQAQAEDVITDLINNVVLALA